VSYAKTAEPIEMPFGMPNRVDPRINHAIDGGADVPTRRGIFRGVFKSNF